MISITVKAAWFSLSADEIIIEKFFIKILNLIFLVWNFNILGKHIEKYKL